MIDQASIRIRDARHAERDAIRWVTLAAYEEYAVLMPEPLWLGYRQQLLATLDAEGPVERIIAEREGTSWAASCFFRRR